MAAQHRQAPWLRSCAVGGGTASDVLLLHAMADAALMYKAHNLQGSLTACKLHGVDVELCVTLAQVFYHLGELDSALTYALGAGTHFNVDEQSEYVQTLIGKPLQLRNLFSSWYKSCSWPQPRPARLSAQQLLQDQQQLQHSMTLRMAVCSDCADCGACLAFVCCSALSGPVF